MAKASDSRSTPRPLSRTPVPKSLAPDAMHAGLFALLRFLRHEFERELEYIDVRMEGVDELDTEGRDLAMEVGHALIEGLEFTRGYVLDAFAALGQIHPECTLLPTPGGERTVAALVLVPLERARPALGLRTGEQVLFDGVHAYLQHAHGHRQLWAEIGEQPLPVTRQGKLPVVR